MANKQIQEAGDNSQQLQANNIMVVNNHGIDEKRAREIYHEMSLQLKEKYTQEALNIAISRVTEFENRFLPKMEAIEGSLQAFADPSFQLLLVEAQKTAAATERPADYDLLSELLIHRFQKGGNRITRAGISRAVEIVDKISDEALLGLTVFHLVVSFFPSNGSIQQGLNKLNDLFGKMFYANLPEGSEWLDHLDILNAIRVSSLVGIKKIQQYYSEMLGGYIDIGIHKNSDNYNSAIEILKNNMLPPNTLVDHELNQDYVRVYGLDKEGISSMAIEEVATQNDQLFIIKKMPLTDAQINAIKSIYDLYNQDDNVRELNVKKFIEEWNKRPNLKILQEWWDNISIGFQLTSVGKVLAHSNAQRCDRSLPPLNYNP